MKDNLENIFKNLENKFDINEPNFGHFNRFEAKLNNANKTKPFMLYKLVGLITAAAAVILFIGIWVGSTYNKTGLALSSVSPKMNETENYYISTIQNQVQLIKNEENSSNKEVINDSFNQLEKLEKQYKLLSLDLKQNKSDPRIIYAMITNYQQRITVLQNLVQQLKDLQQLKTKTHEKYI